MSRVRIGDFSELTVARDSEFGVYLDTGDGDILLPNKLVPAGARIGDRLRVFVYTDSEDRPVATTEKPRAIAGEIAVLEVVDVGRPGAFLDWGLEKDLFLPFREQTVELRAGDPVVVLVRVDERTDRVIATMRLEEHLTRTPQGYEPNQAVDVLVAGVSELGYTVVMDARDLAFAYADQSPEELYIGDARPGWVQRVRPDGRVDVTFRPPAKLAARRAGPEIIGKLEAAGGFLPYHDGSDPADIEREFGMSKKAFKRALAGLYRERRIALEPGGIRAVGASTSRRGPSRRR